MPFKSEAQRRKFGSLVKQGKMSQQTFEEWNRETPAKLPKRLVQKPVPEPSLTDQYKRKFGVK